MMVLTATMGTKQEVVRGWHFVGATLRDGRPVPKDGVWLKHVGPIIPCMSGLHWSTHPHDALSYAPGNTLCLIEGRGTIIPHGDPIDKYVGSERRIVARMDATPLLKYYARMRALSVAHLWDAPQSMLKFLMTGKGAVAARYATRYNATASADASRYAFAAATSATSASATAAAAASRYATASRYPATAAAVAAREEFAALVNEVFADYL